MDRKKIAAGNWKMHTSVDEGVALAKALAANWRGSKHTEMIVAPPLTHLQAVLKELEGSPIHVAAQNCHWENTGAFTGEVSPAMLGNLGVNAVIVGHSERRELFDETNEIVRKKLDAVLNNRMGVILCCGETLITREEGNAREFVGTQIRECLLHLPADSLGSVIIAYEPIWAIGTGVTATADQAQEMHAFIRGLLKSHYSESHADRITILYGGSVKAGNARELFSQPDVDGGLVGGASLDPQSFLSIAAALKP
jgi:triosephosphate isomerase